MPVSDGVTAPREARMAFLGRLADGWGGGWGSEEWGCCFVEQTNVEVFLTSPSGKGESHIGR